MSDPLITDARTRATALITVAEDTIETWYVEADAEVAAILAEAHAEAAAVRARLIREAEDDIVRLRAAADQRLTGECEQIRGDARARAAAETDAARVRAGSILTEAERDATVLRAAEAEYVARQMRDADQAAATLFAAADAEAGALVRQAEATAARMRSEAEVEAAAVRKAAVRASRRLRLDAQARLEAIATRLLAEDGRRHAEMSRLRAALDRALGSPLAGFDIDIPTAGLVDLVHLEEEVLDGLDLTTDVEPFDVPDDLSGLTGGTDVPDLSPDPPPAAVGSRWRRWLHRV
ncbi:MAG: hypothetical protein NVS1B12_00710 [Acidimicrobiales bacterium]